MVGEENNSEAVQELLDELSSQIARDVKDINMLLRIAVALGQQVPDEQKANKRAVKNLIMQFLNGENIVTVPGIFELLSALQETINEMLYEDEHEGSATRKDGREETDKVVSALETENDAEAVHVEKRGVSLGGYSAVRGSLPSNRGGFTQMPLFESPVPVSSTVR